MNPPTLQEVEKELAELDEKIAGLNQLVERKTLLVNYKAIVERVCSNGNGAHANTASIAVCSPVAPITNPASHVVEGGEPETSSSPTVNLLCKVLSSSTKSMKVPDIVKAMIGSGWSASGDLEKDKTTVYNALYNNSGTRFTRVRRGMWTVRK